MIPHPRLLFALPLLWACGKDTPPASPPEATDTPTCADRAVLDTTFPVAADGVDGQIHVTHAMGADRIWLAYNAPDDQGAFQVFATALGCEGEVVVPPILLSTGSANQTDPAIAVSDQGVLVAWSIDTGLSPYNLAIHTALLDLDGAIARAAEPLDMTRVGAPYEGNHWLPSVAPTPDGFVLAGSWGHADAPGFQTFLVDLDASGRANQDAIDLDLQPGLWQVWPQVGTDASGHVQVVWEASGDTGATDIWRADRPVGGSLSVESVGAELASPDVALGPSGSWVAAHTTDAVAVIVTPPSGAPLDLGGQGPRAYAALAAAADGGAVVGWYELDGFYGEVHLVRFDAEGSRLASTVLPPARAAGYPFEISRVSDEVYFVAWQEGDSPAFRAFGRFIRLTP